MPTTRSARDMAATPKEWKWCAYPRSGSVNRTEVVAHLPDEPYCEITGNPGMERFVPNENLHDDELSALRQGLAILDESLQFALKAVESVRKRIRDTESRVRELTETKGATNDRDNP